VLKAGKLSNLRKVESATFRAFVPKPLIDKSFSSANAEFYKNIGKRNGVGHGFQDYVTPNSDRFTLTKVHPLHAFLLRQVLRHLGNFFVVSIQQKFPVGTWQRIAPPFSCLHVSKLKVASAEYYYGLQKNCKFERFQPQNPSSQPAVTTVSYSHNYPHGNAVQYIL
jgi:hypothetical protein